MTANADIRSPPLDTPADCGRFNALQALAPRRTDRVGALVVLEGTNDIEFLKRISAMLHTDDSSIPDLASWENSGQLVFLPFGGGGVSTWSDRLAPLGLPEFHLYDHGLPPETDARQEAVERINSRGNCVATLTGKRSLENYLHPQAIYAAGKIELEFGDFDPIAEMAAKQLYLRCAAETPWESLPRRARKRMTCRAKRWLNTRVASLMTDDLLTARDPHGDVLSWLTTISRLAQDR